MIKYYCEVCGEEIKNKRNLMGSLLIPTKKENIVLIVNFDIYKTVNSVYINEGHRYPANDELCSTCLIDHLKIEFNYKEKDNEKISTNNK